MEACSKLVLAFLFLQEFFFHLQIVSHIWGMEYLSQTLFTDLQPEEEGLNGKSVGPLSKLLLAQALHFCSVKISSTNLHRHDMRLFWSCSPSALELLALRISALLAMEAYVFFQSLFHH